MKEVRSEIKVYCHPKLKARLEQLAFSEEKTLTRYITGLLAQHANLPDMARTPRSTMGRPKKPRADRSARGG